MIKLLLIIALVPLLIALGIAGIRRSRRLAEERWRRLD